jgi:hypothetical protein
VTDGNGVDEGGTDDAEPTLSPDELAGLVDLFGALTRAELDRAVDELAARQGHSAEADVDGAVESYHLVEVGPETATGAVEDVAADDGEHGAGGDGSTLVTPGPVAFPALPAGAEDLPHVLDVDSRPVDRAALVGDVEARLRGDAARAVARDDVERMRHLLDVTYDLEAWASADVGDVRDRLDDALDAAADAADDANADADADAPDDGDG